MAYPNFGTERVISPAGKVRKSFESSFALGGLTGYINAGGRGTRLNTIFKPDNLTGVSKALLQIGKPPITLIEHHINKLSRGNLPRIIAGVGDHLNVAQYIKDTYPDRNNIHAIHYEDQLGNGGDLVRAVREWPELFEDTILLTNVDTLLDVNEADFYRSHLKYGAQLSIALTLNKGVPNEGSYYVGDDNRVIHCGEVGRNTLEKNEARQLAAYRASSTGALIASKAMLQGIGWEPKNGPLSLYREIVQHALENEGMYAFNNGDRLFTDIGIVDSWNNVQAIHDAIQPYIYYAE